jgi:hypothetical protein
METIVPNPSLLKISPHWGSASGLFHGCHGPTLVLIRVLHSQKRLSIPGYAGLAVPPGRRLLSCYYDRMNPSALTFDFDGWKLNGVAIGEDVSRLAFLGEEVPTERSRPVWFEELVNRFTRRKARYLEDSILEYAPYGLAIEFQENIILGYMFFLKHSTLSGYEAYRGAFVNGRQPLSLTPHTTRADLIELFGEPTPQQGEERDPDHPWLTYIQGEWDLTFSLDDDGQLETIEAFWYRELP